MVNSWVDVIAWIGSGLVLLVIIGDAILSWLRSKFGIQTDGTTWSELLRESVGITTFIPWAIAVWIGRWFPILDKPPLKISIALAIVLALSALITVLGDVFMRRRGYPVIPPWLIILLGFAAGSLLIPLPQIY